MTASVVPASLQHIEKAFEIGVGIGMRMIDRIAHPGLRGEMDHLFKPMLRKQRTDGRPIRQIRLHETETRFRPEQIETGLLECRIVIIIHVVKTDDVTAFGQQLTRHMKADKSRRASNQNCLIRHRVPKAPSPKKDPAAASLTAGLRRLQYPIASLPHGPMQDWLQVWLQDRLQNHTKAAEVRPCCRVAPM